MEVFLNNKEVSPGSTISFNEAQGELSLMWPFSSQQLYTVMIYDDDAPKGTYLHFLEVNVPEDDLTKGRIVVEYEEPNPPDGKTHRYTFVAYEQPNALKTRGPKGRVGFNVQKHVSRNGLTNPVYTVIQVQSSSMASHKRSYPSLAPVTLGPISLAPVTSPIRTAPPPTKGGYFKENSELSDAERRMCRCRLHVGAKNNEQCNVTEKWQQKLGGKQCYNPYAVCYSKVKGLTSNERSNLRYGACGKNYNFSGIPDDELQAYAQLSGVQVPKPYDRQRMIKTLEDWKRSKY